MSSYSEDMARTIEGSQIDGSSYPDDYDDSCEYENDGYYDWNDNWHSQTIETDFDISDDNWACGTLEVE